MPFLVEQVLQPQVGLIHLLPCLRSGVFSSACCSVSCTVERLQASYEGSCTYVHSGCVMVEVVDGDELTKFGNVIVMAGGIHEVQEGPDARAAMALSHFTFGI